MIKDILYLCTCAEHHADKFPVPQHMRELTARIRSQIGTDTLTEFTDRLIESAIMAHSVDPAFDEVRDQERVNYAVGLVRMLQGHIMLTQALLSEKKDAQ